MDRGGIMNRRSFFKFLGIGADTTVVAPTILAQEPRNRVFFTKLWTKKILDDRVEEKCNFLGLSKFQTTSMKMRAFWKFARKARIDEKYAKEILESINMESVAEMESRLKKSMDEISERQRIEIERMKKDIERIKRDV
jgi:hypothetical protein